MLKHKILLKLSLFSGIFPLSVGWLIFIIWLLARYLFAIDLFGLAIAGFYWIVISLFIAIPGLLALIVYVIVNRKNLHTKVAVAAFVILINIPSLFIILRWQGKVDQYVFIKLENKGKVDNLDIALISTYDTVKIDNLDPGESEIFHYEVPYTFLDERTTDANEQTWLILSSGSVQDTLEFPEYTFGTCKHLQISEDFKLVPVE